MTEWGRWAIPGPTQVARRWAQTRTWTADRVPPLDVLLAQKRAAGTSISVGIPLTDPGAPIADICGVITRELIDDLALVDELVVLASDAADDALHQARAAGASVLNVADIMAEVPSSPGKGDCLWRSLAVLSGDVIVWIEPNIHNFGSHFVTRLIAPLLVDQTLSFVKGYYERPAEIDIEIDDVLYYAGADRMAELLVRPLLNMLFPELGGFFQPLSAEYAGRRDLFRRIPFLSGWSVDVATLIDTCEEIGLDGMAQADLGQRVTGNRALDVLSPRAYSIARTILTRAQERKRVKLAPNVPFHPLLLRRGTELEPARVDDIERPPMELVPAYLAALAARADSAAHHPAKHLRSVDGQAERERADESGNGRRRDSSSFRSRPHASGGSRW